MTLGKVSPGNRNIKFLSVKNAITYGHLRNFPVSKMAAAREDVKIPELNLMLRRLGKRRKEDSIIKEHNKYISSYFFRQLTEFWNQRYENSITFRPYGSSAEDLKCVEPDDIGDVDIMIFPNADNMMIHDEILEYLPENPLHVRIKGVDHPVLQFCLVEGTDYLATAALKGFHPAIYGSYLPHLAQFVTRSLQVASREGINDTIWQLKNSSQSPAVTLNYAQTNDPLPERLEKQKDPKNLANLDFSDWEWMAQYLCTERGIKYTREHAQVINDYFQYANEVQVSLNECGLSGEPRVFPDVVQELLFSDRAKTLRARYRDIDRRTQNEREKTKHCSEVNVPKCAQGSLPFNAKRHYNADWHGTPRNIDDGQRPAEDLGCPSAQPETWDSPEMRQRFQEKANLKQGTENKDEDTIKGKEKKPFEDRNKNQTGSKPEPHQAGQKDGMFWRNLSSNVEERIYDHWFDHLFEKETDAKADTPPKGGKPKDTEEAQPHNLVGGFDFVPALRSQGWPQVARDWIKRERKWPPPHVVDKIVQEGFHFVVKPPKNGGNPDCDFRISFSHAEYLLSQEMNDIQRELYRCLKRYHRAYLSIEPQGLMTFHLKNILQQTIEETGAEMWTESNRGECMMKLLGNLYEALKKKNLPHFFVRSFNLFGADYIESPIVLDSLARKVEQILENPIKFARDLLQQQPRATIVTKRECVSSTKPTPDAETGQGREMEQAPSKQKTETNDQGSTSLRYHDLQDNFFATTNELIDLAFNDAKSGQVKALEPLERSLVEDLREMNRKHNIPVEVFPMMFEGECWDMAYCKVWINSEPNMRRRMLDGIQGVIETWKYILQQHDFGTGNEEAILQRMLDTTSENPFDLSHVLPAGAGTHLLNRVVNSVKPRPFHRQVMDDIPLD